MVGVHFILRIFCAINFNNVLKEFDRMLILEIPLFLWMDKTTHSFLRYSQLRNKTQLLTNIQATHA